MIITTLLMWSSGLGTRYIFTQRRFSPGKHKNLMDACLSRYCQVIACNYPPIALWHFCYLNLNFLIDFLHENFDLLKSHYCFYARLTRSFFSAYLIAVKKGKKKKTNRKIQARIAIKLLFN